MDCIGIQYQCEIIFINYEMIIDITNTITACVQPELQLAHATIQYKHRLSMSSHPMTRL
jgi:hypothetical protein